MGKIGRNEPCHCGSGKKYKNCHQSMDEQKKGISKNVMIGGLVLFILLVAVGLYLNFQSADNTAPGNAPAGKVWSEEHGHWHDAE